jgi:primosomal protein N' (replication factor Y)
MSNPEKNVWVDVIFPHPPAGRFTYRAHREFTEHLETGHRVLVPLGRRKATAYVVDFPEQPGVNDVREIEDILDPYPLLTPELLHLTRWISEYYLCSWGEAIRAALPPGLSPRNRIVVLRTSDPAPEDMAPDSPEGRILSLLGKPGRIDLTALRKQTRLRNLRFILGKLQARGLVTLSYEIKAPLARIRLEKHISLKKIPSVEELKSLTRTAPRQAAVLEALMNSDGAAWYRDLDADAARIRRLAERGWIHVREKEIFRESYPTLPGQPLPDVVLTEEQADILVRIDRIQKKGGFHSFLIHGVTASGKTRVYMEAIRRVLDQGRTALVLIPEISLTPQAVSRYRGAFGDNVAVLHSRMSPGERFDSWRKIREGRFRIALGPRSAVFSPLDNLGLVVVDEEHETSYKQMDPAPRYHARDVAVMRGKFNDCPVILGSATPSMESYTNGIEKKYSLCRLTKRIDGTPMPRVTVVDMRGSFQYGEDRILSPLLLKRMKTCLSQGEQVILLQNRRGYAPFLRCRECGHIETCPNCDITLTYHRSDHQIRCHYCGYEKRAGDTCSDCGGATFQYRGTGTQKVEEAVRHHFPEKRILRMDMDTTRGKGSHTRMVMGFEQGDGDVLLGTQMVAKGHDFPGVSLVGVISADTGLHFPDFRASERTFQLLMQVSGRAGRRRKQGEVVIQTYSPDHPLLRFILNHDYPAFYEWEEKQRKELDYPPWGRVVMIHFRSASKEKAREAARIFSKPLKTYQQFDCLGPAPSPLARVNRQYRYQIICRTRRQTDPSGKNLRRILRERLRQIPGQPVFSNVRVSVDVDPLDML